MSARERLYISSVGQLQGAHNVQAPSIVVTELEQFLQAALPSGVAELRIQHPLQAWSAVNFQQPQPDLTAPLAPIQFDAALAVDPTDAPPAVPFYASVAERLPPSAPAAEGVYHMDALLRFLKIRRLIIYISSMLSILRMWSGWRRVSTRSPCSP